MQLRLIEINQVTGVHPEGNLGVKVIEERKDGGGGGLCLLSYCYMYCLCEYII